MPRSMAVIPAEQQRNRENFGRAITVWMRRNGWSQQTFHDLAVAAETEGPWNSQISLLQRGRLDCKSMFFVSLARFNLTVAAQAFPSGCTRQLRDRLTGAEPFRNAKGEVAIAMDFYAMFVGDAPIPDEYLAAQGFTDDEATDISEAMRKAFRSRAKELMLSPAEAMDDLESVLQATPLRKADIAQLREVLSGWGDYTAGELHETYDPVKRGLSSWGAKF